MTEAHFLFFPPWIAHHYSLPPCSTFSCFVRVLISLSPLCILHPFDFCLWVTVAWLLMVWFCPDCGWELLQLWPYLCWIFGAPLPGAAQAAGLQVGPSLCLGHPPGHSLTIRESTWSASVLHVPSESPGFSSDQYSLSNFCSTYDPQHPAFLQKWFRISITGFSHPNSGPCSHTYWTVSSLPIKGLVRQHKLRWCLDSCFCFP